MSDSKFWPFVQSPLDNPPDIPTILHVEHPPITTRKGRVVYERKTHFFRQEDLVRISSDVFGVEVKKDKPEFWLQLMEQLTIWMLTQILSKVVGAKNPKDTSERLYYLARNFLARIIDNLLEADKEKLKKELSGGAH